MDDIDDATTPDASRSVGRPLLIGLVLVVAVVAGVIVLWSQREPDETDVRSVPGAESDRGAEPDPDVAADRAMGTVRVRLEPVGGAFIEGFEVGLRFETTTGEVIGSTLWTDFVAEQGGTDIDAFYDSILEQRVPAGRVIVLAEVNVGMGPGPSIPDLAGPLPCRLELDVADGATADVEVGFGGADDCLRTVDPDGPPTTTTAPPPTTTTIHAPVVAGSSFYVDVDLQCRAFELEGRWVLDQGDTSTWQPSGDRHEGGMFTLDSGDHGTFVGDAQGVKTATFRRLAPGESPPCTPVPR